MYRNWRNLIKPKSVEQHDKGDLRETYGKFTIKPLERGFGQTLGNALRRVLLSSLQGAGIVSIRIENVLHEFATIPGIVEDVSEIILNLKQVRLRLESGDTETIRLEVSGEKQVTAGDIIAGENVTIHNPEQHIATLSAEGKIKMELVVKMNKGYVPAERNKSEKDPVGTIALDSTHSPIRRVNYTISNARVGQMTDYDALTVEIWSDGSVQPIDALAFSSKILKEHLQIFINFEEVPEPILEEIREEKPSFNENLNRRVEELELSVRSSNCLQNAKISFIGELCQKTESEMLKTKNFGRKSLNEIKEILGEMGLGLGMKLDSWDFPVEEAAPKDEME
jgi:DNA-directed RNA polymerase subunit alpha